MAKRTTIGTVDSKKFRCCNHPDRPARLPSHVLCVECFLALDRKMNALARPATPTPSTKEPADDQG